MLIFILTLWHYEVINSNYLEIMNSKKFQIFFEIKMLCHLNGKKKRYISIRFCCFLILSYAPFSSIKYQRHSHYGIIKKIETSADDESIELSRKTLIIEYNIFSSITLPTPKKRNLQSQHLKWSFNFHFEFFFTFS